MQMNSENTLQADHDLRVTFGGEYDDLTIAQKIYVIADYLEAIAELRQDGLPGDCPAEVYKKRIWAGNLKSYARTRAVNNHFQVFTHH